MPYENFYSPEESREAEILVEIIYCNPFRKKRQELNRELLGNQYQEADQLSDFSLADADNAKLLNERCKQLIDKGRLALSAHPHPEKHPQFHLYEHNVYFYLYHHLAESMDQFIVSCNEDPRSNPAWSAFTKLKRLYDSYFQLKDSPLAVTYSKSELAAFLFQIRRAFYHTQGSIIGSSEAMTQLRARVWNSVFTHDMRRYLRALFNRMENVFTLITGPSGSGKELVAQAIGLSRFVPFNINSRKFERNYTQVFYPINLSALSETLIESELFGHQKGAFTGALQNQAGYFESCGRYGTVFLDEIGETAPTIQVKLLRVLQTRQFQRLGDTRPIPFRGKVMAATNRNLAKELQEGRFREDFYYRLCADKIETPSLVSMLDANKQELELLVNFIAEKIAGPDEKDLLSEEVISWIRSSMPQAYGWPGNFRELEQCVRNVMVHGEYTAHRERDSHPTIEDDRTPTLNQWISKLVNREYAKTPNLTQVADRLEVDRRTVKKYMTTKN